MPIQTRMLFGFNLKIQLERNTGTLQQIERSLNGLENELQELKEKVG